MKDLYLSQPELLRKIERDFAVTFAGLLLSTGVFDREPDIKSLWVALGASASLAIWRVGRGRVEKVANS